jgi:transposase InsO family protein
MRKVVNMQPSLKNVSTEWVLDIAIASDFPNIETLIAFDAYSRAVIAWEVKEHIVVDDVVSFLDRLVGQYGVPRQIRSDRGRLFTHTDFQSWLGRHGVEHVFMAAW